LRTARWLDDDRLRREFDRSLPFADGCFDRWERARRLGWGEGASVYDSCMVLGEVEVGAQTWVGPFTVLDGSGGKLTIGAHCSISAGVHMYTHDTVLRSLSAGAIERRTGPTSVGNCCHIGSQVVIGAGVRVGSQCVVGANSFVNADVPDRTVVAGSPARAIGEVVGEGSEIHLVFTGR
jgi:carbonic anhydrase/acetyltransferase-like protein (isoleucine patch superfamily)